MSLIGGSEDGLTKSKLDPDCIDMYKKAFDDFDKNKDGTIETKVYIV